MKNTQIIEAPVDSVTVFNKSALVKRAGKIPFPDKKPDFIELCLKNLPLCLEDNSIRVKLPGKTGWAVRYANLEIDRRKKSREVKVEDKINALRDEIKDITSQQKALELQINIIKNWIEAPIPRKEKDEDEKDEKLFPFNAWQAFCEDSEKRLTILYKHWRDLNSNKYRLKKELDITKELSGSEEERGNYDPSGDYCKNLKIGLYCIKEFLDYPRDIEISYIIPGAQWLPVYKLYITKNFKETKLLMGAQVAQRSGEDWKEAKLLFSAANLERIIQLRPLPSRRIGRAQAPPPPSFREKSPPSYALFESFDNWLNKALLEITVKESPAKKLLERCREKLDGLNNIEERPSERLEKPMMITGKKGDTTGELCMAPPPPEAPPSYEPELKSQELPQFLRRSSGFDAKTEVPKPLYLNKSVGISVRFDAKTEVPKPEKKKRKALYSMPPASFAAKEAVDYDAMPSPSTYMAEDKLMEECEILTSEMDCIIPGPEEQSLKSPKNYFNYNLEGVESHSYRGQLKMVNAISVTEYVIESVSEVIQKIQEARRYADVSIFSEAHLPAFQCIFHGSGRASVPSDGHPHIVDIMTEITESEIKYRTVPMTDPKVFKRLCIKNPFETPVPAGAVQVFVDNSYVFTTDIKAVGKGGETYFPMGVEPAIKVSRNTSFSQEEVGFTGGTSVATQGVEINIRSLMPEPVEVEVFERMPVKDEEEKKLDIKISNVEPPGKKVEFFEGRRIRGVCNWDLKIEPGETGAVRLEYKISMPSRMEVSGGNRRV